MDNRKSDAIRSALEAGEIEAGPFSEKEKLALRYAEALTSNPSSVAEDKQATR